MVKNPQRTPVPWFVENNLPGGPRIVHGEPLMSEDKRQELRDDVDLKNQANAAFIVRAVNAHEELLEAVKAAQVMAALNPSFMYRGEPVQEVLRRAVAKAEKVS